MRLSMRTLARVGLAAATLAAAAGASAEADNTRPRILLTGYWPPSNEAVRRFSPSEIQNPEGWIGEDWEGRGYDVYAYFPEFSPPNCQNCGRGTGDLEVDYQDTSADFWRIADEIQPIAIITFSRGFNNTSWELEMNQYNRTQWANDYLLPFQPTPSPPEGSVPGGTLRLSRLPVQAIVDAVNGANLGVFAYICYSGDGGGFLSEFIAYHGVWYQAIHNDPDDPAYCAAAGHVHVGGKIPWPTAHEAAKVTVRTVIDYVDSIVSHPAKLTDFEVRTGTLIGGDLNSLESSDNERLRAQSGYGRTLSDLHHCEIAIDAKTTVPDPSSLRLIVESRLANQTGVERLRLWNFDAGRFEEVGQHAVGAQDTTHVVERSDAAPYFDTDGSIEVAIKHVVVVPVFSFTFTSEIDQVRVEVD